MLPVLWHAEARADLQAILAYIAARNARAAFDLHDAIAHAINQLPNHPYLYRPGRVAGTRELIAHPNYIVVYRVTAVAIEILSVLHSRQQYP